MEGEELELSSLRHLYQNVAVAGDCGVDGVTVIAAAGGRSCDPVLFCWIKAESAKFEFDCPHGRCPKQWHVLASSAERQESEASRQVVGQTPGSGGTCACPPRESRRWLPAKGRLPR